MAIKTRVTTNVNIGTREKERMEEKGREKGGEREEREIIYEKRKILFLVSSDSDTREKEIRINWGREREREVREKFYPFRLFRLFE